MTDPSPHEKANHDLLINILLIVAGIALAIALFGAGIDASSRRFL